MLKEKTSTRPLVSVAPMMDCTDKHDRFFLRLISKNVKLYTEMIVANAIIKGDTNHLLNFNLLEKPLALQIGGSEPKELALASKIAENYGYDEINGGIGGGGYLYIDAIPFIDLDLEFSGFGTKYDYLLTIGDGKVFPFTFAQGKGWPKELVK